MTPTSSTRSCGQVYSIGNYLMTGKVLGKGHFARVEEATHRIIGKKVAIKVIDLTSIKEEYARRNLHREPRVMARLRHPCIAALYETMMHGPRLYVVMEAAGGGDLCAHVLSARGPARGLSETRARSLACQLVSAVRHMHARGVVHRDLKMENIMLDSTKQFIKIVDFGLSNLWTSGGALRTPCGSLEYAAPELFVDGRRYGPEVDLWSIGVIVYGIMTGGLPFTAPDSGGGGKSRPQLRAAIARGFTRKQRAALARVSAECKTFIQHLLEPNVELRMKIEDAARHRWLRRPGMRMKTHPLAAIEPKVNREIYHQISDLSGESVMDVAAQIKADPFGSLGGMYNIKTHLHQMQTVPGVDLLWSNTSQEPRPVTPPEYKKAKYDERPETAPSGSKTPSPNTSSASMYSTAHRVQIKPVSLTQPFQKLVTNLAKPPQKILDSNSLMRSLTNSVAQARIQPTKPIASLETATVSRCKTPSPRFNMASRPLSVHGIKKPAFKTIENNGDCLDHRLPSIEEHSSTNSNDPNKGVKVGRMPLRTPCLRKVSLEDSPLRLCSCPARAGEVKRSEFYRKAGDGLPSWRASGPVPTPTRLLLQSNANTIKRASLGSIVSPHSSTNSHCKSERAAPVGWCSTRPALSKDLPHLQRFRRTAPMK